MKTETTKTKGRYLVLGFVNYIYIYIHAPLVYSQLIPMTHAQILYTGLIKAIHQSEKGSSGDHFPY